MSGMVNSVVPARHQRMLWCWASLVAPPIGFVKLLVETIALIALFKYGAVLVEFGTIFIQTLPEFTALDVAKLTVTTLVVAVLTYILVVRWAMRAASRESMLDAHMWATIRRNAGVTKVWPTFLEMELRPNIAWLRIALRFVGNISLRFRLARYRRQIPANIVTAPEATVARLWYGGVESLMRAIWLHNNELTMKAMCLLDRLTVCGYLWHEKPYRQSLLNTLEMLLALDVHGKLKAQRLRLVQSVFDDEPKELRLPSDLRRRTEMFLALNRAFVPKSGIDVVVSAITSPPVPSSVLFTSPSDDVGCASDPQPEQDDIDLALKCLCRADPWADRQFILGERALRRALTAPNLRRRLAQWLNAWSELLGSPDVLAKAWDLLGLVWQKDECREQIANHLVATLTNGKKGRLVPFLDWVMSHDDREFLESMVPVLKRLQLLPHLIADRRMHIARLIDTIITRPVTMDMGEEGEGEEKPRSLITPAPTIADSPETAVTVSGFPVHPHPPSAPESPVDPCQRYRSVMASISTECDLNHQTLSAKALEAKANFLADRIPTWLHAGLVTETVEFLVHIWSCQKWTTDQFGYIGANVCEAARANPRPMVSFLCQLFDCWYPERTESLVIHQMVEALATTFIEKGVSLDESTSRMITSIIETDPHPCRVISLPDDGPDDTSLKPAALALSPTPADPTTTHIRHSEPAAVAEGTEGENNIAVPATAEGENRMELPSFLKRRLEAPSPSPPADKSKGGEPPSAHATEDVSDDQALPLAVTPAPSSAKAPEGKPAPNTGSSSSPDFDDIFEPDPLTAAPTMAAAPLPVVPPSAAPPPRRTSGFFDPEEKAPTPTPAAKPARPAPVSGLASPLAPGMSGAPSPITGAATPPAAPPAAPATPKAPPPPVPSTPAAPASGPTEQRMEEIARRIANDLITAAIAKIPAPKEATLDQAVLKQQLLLVLEDPDVLDQVRNGIKNTFTIAWLRNGIRRVLEEKGDEANDLRRLLGESITYTNKDLEWLAEQVSQRLGLADLAGMVNRGTSDEYHAFTDRLPATHISYADLTEEQKDDLASRTNTNTDERINQLTTTVYVLLGVSVVSLFAAAGALIVHFLF